MPHGRVPIANGDVEKADILVAVKSHNVHPTKIAHGSLVEENEQLKEMNEQLKKTNVLLMEENNVNRELILVISATLLPTIFLVLYNFG